VRRALYILVFLLIASGAAYFLWSRASGPLVLVVEAEVGPIVEVVYATGDVEPERHAEIASTVTQRITAVLVEEGDQVARGDVLATLDRREIEAKVQELEARLDLRRSEEERALRLHDRGFTSTELRDQAVNAARVAAATLEVAQAQLDEHSIKAPIDGRVLRRDAEVGELALAGERLFYLGQLVPLRIEAEIDEEDIPKVELGQSVLVSADAYPGEVLEGVVSELTLQGDPVARTYRVRIALPEDTPLMTGMTAEINVIVRETAESVLVPVDALDGQSLWIVEDGVVSRHPVRVGVIKDDLAEIRSGLEPGSLLVLNPSPRLVEGMSVRTRDAMS